jgi:cysteine desulfurase
VPVIELAKAARAAGPGAEVEVLSDDPASEHDVPAWCRLRGHDYLGAEPREVGAAYRVRTR